MRIPELQGQKGRHLLWYRFCYTSRDDF
uniref:Uncharacterized protein n=1 Tax=Arundo donax TaxID=35708 RepID=A0A0A8Z2R5_ARUDO